MIWRSSRVVYRVNCLWLPSWRSIRCCSVLSGCWVGTNCGKVTPLRSDKFWHMLWFSIRSLGVAPHSLGALQNSEVLFGPSTINGYFGAHAQ